MNTDISPRQNSEQALTQKAISGPLASRALFWRPRYVSGGRFSYHLPFSFWLADVVRPSRVMAVGIEDGESYFGICQALDKLNIAAMCTGFGTWPEHGNAPDQTPQKEVPVHLRNHNKDHYSDFSTLRWRAATAATKPVEPATLDLLIVNFSADLGDSDLFFDMAVRKMSDRGIILIHDLQASFDDPEKASCLEALRGTHPTVRFGDDDDGVLIILVGPDQDERLVHFTSLKTGAAEFNTAQAVFHQLGAGHYHEWRSAQESRAAKEAQAFAEQSAAERDELEQKYAKLNAAYEERSKKVAAEQSKLYDLQQEIKTLHDQLSQKSKDMADLADTFKAEKDALLAEQDAINSKQTTAQDSEEKKALEFQLQTRFQELAILQREILAVEKRAQQQIRTIKKSTSWRITAPLRAVVLIFRRKKK